MIITMKKGASSREIKHVIERVEALGFEPHPIYGVERTVVAAVGDERGKYQLETLGSAPSVEKVTPILRSYKLMGSEVPPNPEEAFFDGAQSLLPEQFEGLMKELQGYLKLENRHL